MAIVDTPLQKESLDRYLGYALSVISGRALPDVRDGLKPVQRRILYAMGQQLNLHPGASHRKSAAVVGEVLARFHPHGDQACYDALVRMAQDFSLRYPLIDGQGNFGSLDGDNAAAYRYTEVKLREIALDVIGEIDQETTGFRANFDATIEEPVVLPSRVPNLLINGASGIAVGLATSIPPHNIRDVIKALLTLLDEPDITHARLASIVKAPDFPTGCSILNTKRELSDIYKTGRGGIRMRGEWNIEAQPRGKRAIVITSIPYAVNKAQLVEKIAALIIEKKVPQLLDVRDESTTDVRVVLELASDADPETAMAYLIRHTSLESNFAVNLTALVPMEGGGLRPELLSLKDCLQHFLTFREEVTVRRLRYEKKKLEERIHILEGLVTIYDSLDAALTIVRSSSGRSDAAEKLRKRFKLSEIQAFAVVDMRIYQLSRTNIGEIRSELAEKESRVKEIEKILKNRKQLLALVRKDLESCAEKYGDKRRCKIELENIEVEFDESAYVVEEDVYAIITSDGWLKRIRQANELSSTRLREGDKIARAHPLSTRDMVVFFTNYGSVFSLRASDFPSSSGYGTPIQKIMRFKDGEAIVDSFGMLVPEGDNQALKLVTPYLLYEGVELVAVSRRGIGYAFPLKDAAAIKKSGKRAVKLREGDVLCAVCPLAKRVAFFTRKGSGLAVAKEEIPLREGAAVGVILMSVRAEDALVDTVPLRGGDKLCVSTAAGGEKEILGKDICTGRRGLKGTKVISRGEILAVEVVS